MKSPPPLAGVRVLDFGHIIAGPFCARLLADLGADVVKIETSTRQGQLGARRGSTSAAAHGRTPLLAHINRSRRSIDLNLKVERDREVAQRLAAVADVIVENFSTGVMERLGLGYHELAQQNPKVIYASMSGYGNTGPRRDWTSMNVNLQAHCGLMMATGDAGDPPIGIANSWNDYISGLHACVAIVGALMDRADTTKGKHLDISQFECCVATLGASVIASAVDGVAPARQGNRSTEAMPQGCYRCAGDDEWCTISVQTDAQWSGLKSLIPGLDDVRFADRDGRARHHDEIDRAIEAWTSSRTPLDVESAMQSKGAPAERVRRGFDLLDTPEWKGLLRPAGDLNVIGLPFVFGAHANVEPFAPPRVGEHSAEILREWLKSEDAEFVSLSESQVTG